MPRIVTILVVLAAFATPFPPGDAAADEIYRWVDEDGVVHYGRKPPADREATRLEGAPPPADDPERQRERIEELRQEIERTVEERRARREARERERERAEARAERCRELRRKLNMTINTARVRDKEDDYRVMTPAEREQEIRRLRERIEDRCEGE